MSATAAAPAAEEKKGGKKKLIIIVVALLVVAGAAYFFLLKPKPADAAKPKPVAGVVTPLDPIQINLEGGHYLRVGIALQQTDKAAEALDGSKALDAAIELFSGKSIEELSKPKERVKLKKELVKELEHLYEDEVMDVYFTQFVMQ
ncbi:flagellar basal body-associated FliL family protein [Nocardioides sp. TRM66260-LWL]|uniref:flagellar basal body-associated FliL family protein n=1 Tax=Nocardioides sp. TRM66260-LWL TaxID=2874478 RepID=UPI001CC39AD8|nr:flagellar basal body-associated FliL family protein [Nocardioides sp. TRM66260-LWL]MBZ5735191.1 flagellar basal body-associated FliL family protein [Nocardioides sp. TRM66260-LWL]